MAVNPLTRPTDVERLKLRLNDMNLIMVGIIVVLFIGLATAFVTVWGLVLDATRFKTETYQDLINKVSQQEDDIRFMRADLASFRGNAVYFPAR